jgi:hypothetical protein
MSVVSCGQPSLEAWTDACGPIPLSAGQSCDTTGIRARDVTCEHPAPLSVYSIGGSCCDGPLVVMELEGAKCASAKTRVR